MKKPFAPAEKSNVLQLTRMEQISIPNIDSPNVQFSNGLYTTSRLKENYITFNGAVEMYFCYYYFLFSY